MKESWKTLDTTRSKNMNFFCIPGRLQIQYYTKCKKIGVNPHKDLQTIIEKRLVELGINTKLDELRKQRDMLDDQIRGIEENTSNPLLLNSKLKKDVEARVGDIMVSLQHGEQPTPKWLFFISKALANRYDLLFNDVIDLLKESLASLDQDNPVFGLLELVRERGNNGCLSDEEIQLVFEASA